MTYKLLATAASGIEALVGDELKKMGYDVQVENGRARFEGDKEDIAKANLWLRTADRVKIIVGEFEATTFDDLFEETKALPWDEYYHWMQRSRSVENRSSRPYTVCRMFSVS